MASIEVVEARVREAAEPGFRERLMARGEARSKIWRDGVLPPESPDFSVLLSYDLLSYGYTLLSDGLTILENDGNPETARLAFNTAAHAIESAIQNGPDNKEADFHRFASAAGYHLARYSARAFSMLHTALSEANLTASERCLSLLMLREIEELEAVVRDSKLSTQGDDATILEELTAAVVQAEQKVDADVPEAEGALFEALDVALGDGFMSAIAEALLGLEVGSSDLVRAAQDRLQTGVEIAAEAELPNQWWCHKLAKFLIGDLWDASFHERLPSSPPEAVGNEWGQLRSLFIASLFRRRRAEIDLWPSQLEAADRALDVTDNMVVSLPTGAGKTRIAEIAILACLASGKRIMFVTPLRALSAQTEAGLQRTFVPLGKSVSSLYGSIGAGAADENILRERDIIVATPEKLDFALRNDPSLLEDIGLIVLDEGHMIGLGEREIRYEAQIQRLLRRSDADNRRIICLSAILPNDDRLEDFVEWLTDDSESGLVENNWRPTRLRFGEIDWRGRSGRLEIYVGKDSPWVTNFIEEAKATRGNRQKPFPCDQRELCIAVAWRLVKDGQSVLIYCPEKRSVEPYAREIVRVHKQGLLPSLPTLPEGELEVALSIGREWFEDGHPLLECLKLGIAIHHGSLPTPYRREVERLLRAGKLKITVSSPTLAQGLNLTATALVFHGLKRGRDVIEISQFRNVIGRAGRAFIDVEGLVLLPMYKDQRKRRKEWKEMIEDSGGKEMESGLLLLVQFLMRQIIARNGIKSLDQFREYVANQAAWDFTPSKTQSADENADDQRRWDEYVSLMDTAILSLTGDSSEAEEAVEDALDEILRSSLWARRLVRRGENTQKILDIGLKARAKHLWSATTPVQRKAYFLAGLGLSTGRGLDEHAERLTELLISVNGAILNGDHDVAIDEIVDFAEIIFEIAPFQPRFLPSNWRELADLWLRGRPMSEGDGPMDREALEFVEEALVYKLPWALEAVRVRASAHEIQTESGLSIDDLSLGYAVAALETGAIEVPVSLLIQIGFQSRSGAHAAIEATQAEFDSVQGLRQWLRSDEIRQLEQDDNWPTSASHAAWNDFRLANRDDDNETWGIVEHSLACQWQAEHKAEPLTPVRLVQSDNKTLIATPSFEVVGRCIQPYDFNENGLVLAYVSSDQNIITAQYLGPV